MEIQLDIASQLAAVGHGVAGIDAEIQQRVFKLARIDNG
jgi:hypothetical protein